MEKILYTWGYGNIAMEEFTDQLREFAAVDTLRFWLVDLRQRYCRSPANGKWCTWLGMRVTIQSMNKLGVPVELLQLPELSNSYGPSVSDLQKYAKYIDDIVNFRIPFNDGAHAFFSICDLLWGKPGRVILMDPAKKPFKENRGIVSASPNSHRVPLANKIVEVMGNGWLVEHLQ